MGDVPRYYLVITEILIPLVYVNEKLGSEGNRKKRLRRRPKPSEPSVHTPEGKQQKQYIYCHQETPNLSNTPPNEGLNNNTIFLGEGKVQLNSSGSEVYRY